MSNFKEDLSRIKAFLFDIDGVLSQQTIGLGSDGIPIRSVNLRDGYALQLSVKQGYRVGVISGGHSPAFEKRLNLLGVSEVNLNIKNKKEVFTAFLEKEGLDKSEVLYMGDDIPDYEVMKLAGVAVCPSDADSEIKQVAHYISDKKGGEGCVRDVIEQVMRLHGKWMNNNEAYVW